MKLVLATRAHVNVDTCAKHGVWFDAGDLLPVMRAVALILFVGLGWLSVRYRNCWACPWPLRSGAPCVLPLWR